MITRIRILPDDGIKPDPKVSVIGKDDSGFTILEAELEEDENVCWRCGSVAKDPDKSLQICPVCGKDFND